MIHSNYIIIIIPRSIQGPYLITMLGGKATTKTKTNAKAKAKATAKAKKKKAKGGCGFSPTEIDLESYCPLNVLLQQKDSYRIPYDILNGQRPLLFDTPKPSTKTGNHRFPRVGTSSNGLC